MNKEMVCHEIAGKERKYRFHCPSCDEAGDLGLMAHESGGFGCPAECGARFIEYDRGGGEWAICCVVQPIY